MFQNNSRQTNACFIIIIFPQEHNNISGHVLINTLSLIIVYDKICVNRFLSLLHQQNILYYLLNRNSFDDAAAPTASRDKVSSRLHRVPPYHISSYSCLLIFLLILSMYHQNANLLSKHFLPLHLYRKT